MPGPSSPVLPGASAGSWTGSGAAGCGTSGCAARSALSPTACQHSPWEAGVAAWGVGFQPPSWEPWWRGVLPPSARRELVGLRRHSALVSEVHGPHQHTLGGSPMVSHPHVPHQHTLVSHPHGPHQHTLGGSPVVSHPPCLPSAHTGLPPLVGPISTHWVGAPWSLSPPCPVSAHAWRQPHGLQFLESSGGLNACPPRPCPMTSSSPAGCH